MRAGGEVAPPPTNHVHPTMNPGAREAVSRRSSVCLCDFFRVALVRVGCLPVLFLTAARPLCRAFVRSLLAGTECFENPLDLRHTFGAPAPDNLPGYVGHAVTPLYDSYTNRTSGCPFTQSRLDAQLTGITWYQMLNRCGATRLLPALCFKTPSIILSVLAAVYSFFAPHWSVRRVLIG
eukprot:SAG22_NODE_595_length_8730_cov_4.200672_4_plen_179_part_00